jgi:hypothetical protein
MKTFDFYIDTKVTDWYRTTFEIEANSEEEAKQKAIKFVEDDHHGEIPWEQIDCTIEPMSVKDNGGECTEELYDNSTGNVIWDNSKTN